MAARLGAEIDGADLTRAIGRRAKPAPVYRV